MKILFLELFFSYFPGGTYFRTHFVSHFGPKAQNLFPSRPSGSPRKGASEVRCGTSSTHFHCSPPRSSSHVRRGKLGTWGVWLAMFRNNHPAELRGGFVFARFFSNRGGVKFGMNFGEISKCHIFQGLGVRILGVS